jgi:hypothetical protein
MFIKKNIFYMSLFEVLTKEKIHYPFKLSLSNYGMPYISCTNYAGSFISSIVRATTSQPSLLRLLSGRMIDIKKSRDIRNLGIKIGSYFEQKLNRLRLEERKHVSDVLSHNLLMLCKSYDTTRDAEIYCLHKITQCFLEPKEYYALIYNK